MNIVVLYPTTNECTNAILAGLDIRSYDKVFAICGSGDQAFAMLERADTVLAVDNSIEQFEYADKRLKSLRKSRSGFYSGYYHKPDKDRLQTKSEKIEFKHLNIEDIDFSPFNKAYFSNAVTYGDCDVSSFLNKILSEIKSDSLAYFVDMSSELISRANRKSTTNKFYLERKLTKKARKKQNECECGGYWSGLFVYRILPRDIEFV